MKDAEGVLDILSLCFAAACSRPALKMELNVTNPGYLQQRWDAFLDVVGKIPHEDDEQIDSKFHRQRSNDRESKLYRRT